MEIRGSVCSFNQVIQESKPIGTQKLTKKLFIKILTVIIVIETGIMVGLYALPTEFTPWQNLLVYVAFLALFSTPMIYFLVIQPYDREYVLQQFDRSTTTNTPFDVEHRITRQDNGEVRWVHEKCVHDRDVMGNVVQSHGIVQDITDRKLAQQKIKQMAMTDQLTGLANRNQFYATFDKFINMAKRDSALLGVMILDLDMFKAVHDIYGHQTGDKLLHIIAQVFRENCREIDLIARLGGDEFAIVLYKPLDKGAIREVANRIVRAFEAPIHVNGHRLQVGVSIGISIFPTHGTEQHTLIESADAASQKIKRQSKTTFVFTILPTTR